MTRRETRLAAVMAALAWGTLFGLAYGQEPLFTSNQNQYFLHGLAAAGVEQLSQDWLANTLDPTPVFSWLVQFTAEVLDLRLSCFYFLLLAMLCLVALVGIVEAEQPKLSRPGARLWLLAGLFLTNAAALRTALGQAIGGEWAFLFDGGVAGQRLLGTVLQPSCFGVLLLLAVHQFLRSRPYRAVLASAAAATVHPTYLLVAAALVALMLLQLYSEGNSLPRLLAIGALALASTAPILMYLADAFLPANPDAQGILVDFRLPAHADPAEWLDASVLVKGLLVLAAAWSLRRGRLFNLLVGLTLVTVGLTLAQNLTGSDALALLFPWRISTVLVPLSSAVLLGRLAASLEGWFEQRHPGRDLLRRGVPLVLIGLSAVGGILWSAAQFLQQRQAPERAVMTYVARNKQAGETYLVPPKLQDFRLGAGVPILADFKSIPYRGGEVIEWHDRVRLAQWFFQGEPGQQDCGLLNRAQSEYGVTHLVLGPEQLEFECAGWVPQYRDSNFAVVQLSEGSP